MAELASVNAPGGAKGDTFEGRTVKAVLSDDGTTAFYAFSSAGDQVGSGSVLDGSLLPEDLAPGTVPTVADNLTTSDGAQALSAAQGVALATADGLLDGRVTTLENDAVAALDDLSDVDTSTAAPTTGQALVWDGTNFVPGDTAAGFRNYTIARGDAVANVAPTAGETPDLPDLATATVTLTSDVVEYWSYSASTWTLTSTQTPATLDGNHAFVSRADTVASVEPTAAEIPTAESGDTATVFLSDGTREHWGHNGTAWGLQATVAFTPTLTQAQAEDGTSTHAALVSGERLKQAIDAHVLDSMLSGITGFGVDNTDALNPVIGTQTAPVVTNFSESFNEERTATQFKEYTFDPTATGDYDIASTNIAAEGGTVRVSVGTTPRGTDVFTQVVGSQGSSDTIAATSIRLTAGVRYYITFDPGGGVVMNQSEGPTVLTITNTAVDPFYIPAEAHGAYADDAAAIAGGLTAGAVYFSTTEGKARAVASGALETTPLNASLALPAATGSGETFIYEVGTASPIELTDLGGGTVGGVTTYTASNHGAGAKLLVSDSAAGEWDVSVVGAPQVAVDSIRSAGVTVITSGIGSGAKYFNPDNFVASDSGNLTVVDRDVDGWRTGDTWTVPAGADGEYDLTYYVLHPNQSLVGSSTQNGEGSFWAFLEYNGERFYGEGDNVGGARSGGTISLTLDLKAGDTIKKGYRSGDMAGAETFYSNLTIKPHIASETVLAGTVTPTPLVFYSDIQGATSQSAPEIDLGPSFIIPSDGDYEVTVHLSANLDATGGNSNAYVVAKDGSNNNLSGRAWPLIAATAQDGANNNSQEFSSSDVFTLSAGTVVKLRGSTGGTPNHRLEANCRLTVRQLPSSTVVMPDAMDVGDARVLITSGTMGNSTAHTFVLPNSQTVQDLANTYEKLELAMVSSINNRLIFGSLDLAVLLASDQGGTPREWAVSEVLNASNARVGTWISGLDAASDQLTLNSADATDNPWYLYGVKKQRTVDPAIALTQQVIGDVLIEDRGIFREMWSGEVAGGGSGTDSVIFPLPFQAGSTPVVEATSTVASRSKSVTGSNATGATFQGHNGSTAQGGVSFTWHAIGLKPT